MATTVEKESTGFTIGQQVSMFITVEASIFSGIATLGLLSYKLFLFLRRSFRKQLEKREEDACDSSLFISLMVGEVLRSIGATMTLRWVLDGSITHDTFCVAQGYIKLIGTNAIDFTYAITVQTFCILILRWKAPKHLAKFFTMAVWTVVLLITVISFAVHRNDLMGPTNFWCWIPRKHRVTQIMAEYIWMWTIGVVTAILYGLGYFVVRGKLTLGRNRTGDHLGMDAEDDQELRQMANQLLV
ncbi:hypothetical protein FA15DRAFT_588770 [Coprinopsis marcescibilis]|uniref:Uncharacterized protein n=1 Tax=Coprinopsis marcescibilis TaxID=230819 RepID=A0A5C3LD10_COPMA|nr:hypothetical protein FA15DRAFT_588770 [Coprinopsis marcescibilis]